MLRLLSTLACVCLVQGVVAQGYNRRYDSFGQGFVQGAFGIEKTAVGNILLSGSFEPDTIAPDSLVATYSLILQYLDQLGNVQLERRYKRQQHAVFLGWADCCDTVPDGGLIIGGSS